jgi:hypothetical protein
MKKMHNFDKITPNAYNFMPHLTPKEAAALEATGDWDRIQHSVFMRDKTDPTVRIIKKMMNPPSYGDIESVFVINSWQPDPIYYSNREKWQGYSVYGWLIRKGSYRDATPQELESL